ncbi:hypothetical protein [uncultured Kordia sp.]|uniref:hypothetical protein n=1 Tax=uncultured Kordia sp. TaxID=507699 RepID=UPI002603B506|nr:hypothetical protein [uncultured Kordia sp.]
MKKITSKQLRLNKISVSKLSSLLGGNPTKNPGYSDDCPEETDTCTTSRTTVDLNSNDNFC